MSNIAHLESIVYWVNMLVILSLLFSFIGGAASIIYSSSLNKVKDKQSAQKNAEADKQIAALNARTEEAVTKQKELEQRNLTLNGVVAKLQFEAATAERSLLELQERMKPRQFTEQQRVRLIELLKNRATGAISIFCVGPSTETINFGKQIGNILTSAGWEVSGVDAIQVFGSQPSGLFIKIRGEKSRSSERACQLQKGIAQVGFPVRFEYLGNMSEDHVEMTVGVRP